MSRFSLLFTALLFVALLGCDKGTTSPEPATAPQGAAAPAPATEKAPDKAADKAPDKAADKAVAPAAAPVAAAPSDTSKEGESQIRLKENPFAGKAEASDGKSLAEAKELVATMARELKRSTAAVVMAGKDKDKVDAIGADFQKLNKTMSKRMEEISERLTPEELADFEEHTRVILSPLINQLLQAFFSSGGLKPDGAGPNGTTKLVPANQDATTSLSPTVAGAQAPAAAPAPAPVAATPTATPVAAALGAGATGAAAPGQPGASPAPAAPQADSVPLLVAKAGIDSMAKELSEIVERIRAADNDKIKLRQINKDYTSINQKHAASIPKLVGALNDQQKAAFGEYLKSRLMPVSSQLVEAFTAAGHSPNQ